MKKITVITGSPRVKGNTNIMAEAFIAAAENAGGTMFYMILVQNI